MLYHGTSHVTIYIMSPHAPENYRCDINTSFILSAAKDAANASGLI